MTWARIGVHVANGASLWDCCVVATPVCRRVRSRGRKSRGVSVSRVVAVTKAASRERSCVCVSFFVAVAVRGMSQAM